MADDDNSQFESALKTLLDITEKSGNLRKDLKQDIVDSVSILRNIFVNLKSSGKEQTTKINQLASELNKAKADLKESRIANLMGRALPSRGSIGQTSTSGRQNQTPSIGGAKKLYSEAVKSSVDKRYKLLVKSKLNLSTEAIKNALKANVNPTAMKIGVKSFKSLKDGRVLIEAGTSAEIALISDSIRDKCGDDLEVTVPKLRKPRMIIHNVPQDVTIENLQETVLAQNPELGLAVGDIEARFTFRTKRGSAKMVIEVGSETRKKLLDKKLKIGWLICNVDDYLVAKRCFKCSRFNHRHQDCRGEETCPLCAGGHKLKECMAQAEQHRCINCMTYNRYSKADKVSENHSSLDKNCPSMQAVLAKYRLNTDY
jgi:hypothetical protein